MYKKGSIGKLIYIVIALFVLVCMVLYITCESKWALFVVSLFTVLSILLANIRSIVLATKKKKDSKTVSDS